MSAHFELLDGLEVFLETSMGSGRVRPDTVKCLAGLVAYTRLCGPVGCRVDDAAEFICGFDPSLEFDLVVRWLLTTEGMGVSGGGTCY